VRNSFDQQTSQTYDEQQPIEAKAPKKYVYLFQDGNRKAVN
jgi:hypothetical protein